jgi:hypothetical protein
MAMLKKINSIKNKISLAFCRKRGIFPSLDR